MNKILIIVALVFVMGIPVAKANPDLVISSDDSFSFEIPDGWSLVSNEEITARKSKVEHQLNSKASSTLDFVLKKDNAEAFQPPFIIINRYSHGGLLTAEKFKEKYSLDAKKQVLQGLSGEAVRQGIIRNLHVGGKIYDDQNQTFLMRGQMTREGVGNLDSILAVLLGKSVLVNITFADFQSNYNENVNAFEGLLSSFQFRNLVSASVNEKEKGPSWWQKDLIKVGAWIPIIAVLYLISWIFNKFKSKGPSN